MARLKRLALLGAIFASIAIPVGGGATFVAMEITARPEFCRTCHYMEKYYQSWATSSHKNVQCVDCHYEPGLLETFEGKFKALSQLAKYVTRTEGTKPWAEVSDYSCLRSGCHSTQLLEGEIQYGRIRFDHRQHLIGLPRGKQLRCTSCHSQIVQGDHLTVTPSTCILCHFRRSEESKPIDDCHTCHGPPEEEIDLGGFVFRHSDYLERGVECKSCHGDVTRGAGDVPRQRCGSCHNEQEHLDRYDDVEFIHRNHITDHSVSCGECHNTIEHGLPSREHHFQGDCKDCHSGTHASVADLYRGTGGRDVPDNPGVMFLARVTCNGCHRPPFPGAPEPPGGTYRADPLACLDCHGPAYEGMAEGWKKEVRRDAEKVKGALEELFGMLGEEWEEGDAGAARKSYERAAHNYGLVLLDRSDGVHNLPYVRDLLRKAVEDVSAGMRHLDPDARPPKVAVGPRAPSKEGCTVLCHSTVEERSVPRAFDLPFAHDRHFLKAGIDCSKCHAKEPHGTTVVGRADCVSCHHAQEEPQACASCHAEVQALRAQEAEGANMADLDCLACHEGLAERAPVKAACDSCHKGEAIDYDAWKESALAPLREVEEMLAAAPADAAAAARAELEALRRQGPHHNVAHARATAARLKALLGNSTGGR